MARARAVFVGPPCSGGGFGSLKSLATALRAFAFHSRTTSTGAASPGETPANQRVNATNDTLQLFMKPMFSEGRGVGFRAHRERWREQPSCAFLLRPVECA